MNKEYKIIKESRYYNDDFNMFENFKLSLSKEQSDGWEIEEIHYDKDEFRALMSRPICEWKDNKIAELSDCLIFHRDRHYKAIEFIKSKGLFDEFKELLPKTLPNDTENKR